MEFLYSICGLQKKGNEELKEHIRREHSDDRLVKCDQCDKVLEGKKKLSNHMRIHSSNIKKKCENYGQYLKIGSNHNHVTK